MKEQKLLYAPLKACINKLSMLDKAFGDVSEWCPLSNHDAEKTRRGCRKRIRSEG